MTREEELIYEKELRRRVRARLLDLTAKIENNEPCPDSQQDYHLLSEIEDKLNECLNNWYY